MLTHSSCKACFEHLVFLTVKEADHTTNPIKGRSAFNQEGSKTRHNVLQENGTRLKNQKFDYEPFNCNNFNIRYWSWYYRGCWHQTCPPIDFVKEFKLYSFQLSDLERSNIVISCHYLPVSGLGNLRACCLPWKW